MTNYDSLIDLNQQAADIVANPEVRFDQTTSDLIMRNIAVATDRLSPEQFARLSPDAQDAVFDAANAASELAPLDPRDQERLPYETASEHAYRISVYHPLHSLQAWLHVGGLRPPSPQEEIKLKQSIQLGSRAFKAVISETSGIPVIDETLGYFMSNALAAAARAKRLSRDY
jgi:hypothetical protein